VPEAPAVLDANAFRAWCLAGEAALVVARDEIDSLNVYPVPDGDTGTNLALTMRAVADAVREPSEAPLGALAGAVARAALMGAKGNSGVILSQLVRGFADVVGGEGPPVEAIDGALLARALDRAADAARSAVTEPVEGTILTVARAAADAACTVVADHEPPVPTVAEAARDGAVIALAKTTDQLPSLAAAGVVDAGAKGLVVLLDALVDVLDGAAPSRPEYDVPPPIVDRSALRDAREQGSPEFAFEVMYLLDAPDDVIADLRRRLVALGDSVVVAGGDGTWRVHVHVNDVDAAVAAGGSVGRPHRIEVTHFATQVAEQRADSLDRR
jgi:DAK2 domain fusion protein YloV